MDVMVCWDDEVNTMLSGFLVSVYLFKIHFFLRIGKTIVYHCCSLLSEVRGI